MMDQSALKLQHMTHASSASNSSRLITSLSGRQTCLAQAYKLRPTEGTDACRRRALRAHIGAPPAYEADPFF